MTARSIDWHKSGQVNFKLYIDITRIKLQELSFKLERMEKDYNFIEEQIKKAIKQGKKSFDSERFLRKNKNG